jgi:hypothetical protein
MITSTSTITHGNNTAGRIEKPLQRLVADRSAHRADDAIRKQARAVIKRGGGQPLALGFGQRPSPQAIGPHMPAQCRLVASPATSAAAVVVMVVTGSLMTE